MAINIADYHLDHLNVEDRLELVHQIWDSITSEVERMPLSEAQQVELDRRLTNHRQNPDAAIPWEQVESEARSRLKRREMP